MTCGANCRYTLRRDAVLVRPRKDAANKRKHGISLQRANDFDLDAAYVLPDTRREYGECRFRAIGFVDARLYALVFTERDGGLRAISLRKARKEEQEDYAQAF